MNLKKITAVCTTALLAIGLAVTGMGAASADDATVPAEAVTSDSVVQEAPAPEALVDVVAEPVIETPTPLVVEESEIETQAKEIIPATQVTAKANSPPAQQRVSLMGGDHSDKKVWVCKYVGTPGVNETLKGGTNPIEVSKNSLDNGFAGVFPFTFSDNQEKSVAIGWADTPTTISDCPTPETPGYVIAAWSIDSGSTGDLWPQTLVKWKPINSVDIDALDGTFEVECGAAYQIDVYDASAKTAALIAGSVLDYSDGSSVGSKEDHVRNAGLNYSWKFVEGDDCPKLVTGAASIVQNECNVPGSLTLTGDNVRWTITIENASPFGPAGTVKKNVTANTYSLGTAYVGDVSVEAVARDGFTLANAVNKTFTFTEAECLTMKPCVETTDGGVSTNLAPNGWTFNETRAPGHNDYVEGGLHVWTESNGTTDKAAGYKSLVIPFSEVGNPSIEFASYSGVRPSVQIGFDKDGNGSWDGYLVYEPWAYGEGNWWSSKDFGVGSGMDYASFGTLTDYLQANPDAKTVNFGYSLGSGVKGDAVITSITVGCAVYTFDHELADVATETVLFSDHTCDVVGMVSAPAVEGVRYEATLDGTVDGHVENFPAGTFFATDDGTESGELFYGTITIKAFAVGDVQLTGTTEWTHEFTEALCPVIITETPLVKFVDECGTENDEAVYEDTEEYTFSEEIVDGQIVVTATANEGFEFEEGVQTVWTSEFTNEECPTPVVPEKPETPTKVTDSLPRTGGNDLTPIMQWGFLLLGVGAVGIGATIIRRRLA